MILRRVMQHVRNQEWTAIVIDLIIVVVGVYVGIQAQAWNAERENRAIEKRYLLRLHDEISGMIENDADRVEAARSRLAALKSTVAQLAGSGEDMQLTTYHCDAVRGSHIYVGRISVPPTIEELLSTGRLLLISNNALRSEIVTFSQSVESYRQLVTDIQADRLTLSRVHPLLITMNLLDEDSPDCHFEAMRQSPAFLNHLADNRARYEAYAENVVLGQQELRVKLHALLDEQLELDHADTVSN